MENASTIPDDIWLHVFKYLDLQSISKVCLVCKKFNQLASSNFVWKLLEKHFVNNTPVNG